jgi:hypothetical protein
MGVQEPKAVVTMKQALDDLIETRVMGNDGFGAQYSADDDRLRCVYNKANNGGCAIGRFLPDGLDTSAFEGWGVEKVFRNYPVLAAGFEDPTSRFWSYLQMAHDSLAHYALNPVEITGQHRKRWGEFQESLRTAIAIAIIEGRE